MSETRTGAGACETRLLMLILAQLMRLERDGHPMHFWRHNVGAAVDRTGRTLRFGRVGQSDLLGLVRGRFVAIEVKTETGRVTAEQREWGARVERAGGVYIVARCLEDAMGPVLELIDTCDPPIGGSR